MLISLIELKHHVEKLRIASLQAISQHFNADPEFLRGMLNHWVSKGCIRCSKKTAKCGSQCTQCAVAITEMYEWVGSK